MDGRPLAIFLSSCCSFCGGGREKGGASLAFFFFFSFGVRGKKESVGRKGGRKRNVGSPLLTPHSLKKKRKKEGKKLPDLSSSIAADKVGNEESSLTIIPTYVVEKKRG